MNFIVHNQENFQTNSSVHAVNSGPGSSVSIATGYVLDSPGIESRWGRDFLHVQNGPGAHPASSTMGIGSFPGVKRPGHGADYPIPASAKVKKG
jgi:hypothetical protein